MKKIVLIILALGAVVALGVYIYVNVFKNGSYGFQGAQNTADTSSLDDSGITSSTSINETADSDLSTEGGNPDIASYIEVTVSEDKYFYENHEISYDDLIKVLDGLDGKTAVRISDENATLKAYESLTKALAERGILFEAAS